MKLKSFKRKLVVTFLFSLLASVGMIIHGVFFDLDVTQLQRWSIGGFAITFLVTFPSLLLLEWIFDLENKEEFKIIERKVAKLERRT